MTAPRCSESEFIALLEAHGAAETARRLGNMPVTAVFKRRRFLEQKHGRQIKLPDNTKRATRLAEPHPGRLAERLENGVVLVGSDAHCWPGINTTARRAFLKFCKELKPIIVVVNGDIFDGASISRHAPIMWEDKPTVIQELEACQEFLGEVQSAAFKARKYWPLGNHDGRFESRLAVAAPEYAQVHGVHLKDHFPDWNPCWSLWINDNVVVKHRFKGGVYATRNNALMSGKSVVTGHLHALQVTPHSDYTGTRFGVDTGTLADPYGPQFEYLEDSPRSWRGGFAVLTFWKGRLLWPELVHVIGDGQVEFRGIVHEV